MKIRAFAARACVVRRTSYIVYTCMRLIKLFFGKRIFYEPFNNHAVNRTERWMKNEEQDS